MSCASVGGLANYIGALEAQGSGFRAFPLARELLLLLMS
jgi:hypothetical protein